jgi:hypothetical protein
MLPNVGLALLSAGWFFFCPPLKLSKKGGKKRIKNEQLGGG